MDFVVRQVLHAVIAYVLAYVLVEDHEARIFRSV